MKKLAIIFTALILLSVLPFPSQAQIPNAGFEQWTAGQPDGWFTSNILGLANITQSSTKHSGSYALRGEVAAFYGYPYTAFIMSGVDGVGFPITQRHATLTGYYQFSPVGGDEFEVLVIFYKDDVGIATGSFITANAAASFTQFAVDIAYYSDEVPNMCDIMIIISSPTTGGDCHVGSAMIVDDLSFSGTTAVQEYSAQSQFPERFSLAQAYPNPFNPACTIEYAVPEVSQVSVRVYDILGREIATLFQGINVPGIQKVQFQPDQLPGGLYFYQMIAKSLKSGKTFSEVKKAMYIK